MKKSILFILLSIPVINGCIVAETPITLESVNNQISSAYPTPTSTFVPTPTPIPTPTASVFFTGDILNDYSRNIKCLPIDKNFKPKLDYPIDLVVTKDGKKVYVLNKRLDLAPSNLIIKNIKRQFIYEINEDKKISALKVDGDYPFSCHLSEEIEIDKNDNLYITKPTIDFNYYTYVGHEIYKVTSDKQMSLYSKIELNTPKVAPTSMPDPVILTNLHLTENNELFYLLRSRDIENYDKLSMFDINKNIRDILYYYRKYNGEIRDFAVYNAQIYTSLFKFDIKERRNTDSLGDFLLKNEGVESIYNKGNGIVYGETVPIKKDTRILLDSVGNVYISDNESHVIWKIIPNKEIIKFAGNGQAGYKDGKAGEAQFNNPNTMTFDGQGNMFVADSGNNAIRKITPDGIVSTFYKESN